jgi:hypothetical protein
MDQNKKIILKKYIKKILKESQALPVQSSDETTILSQLSQTIYKPFPIGTQEFEAIKQSIKSVKPDKFSVDIENNTVSFTISGTFKNFNCTLRKIINQGKQNQFKYVLWRVPFKEMEQLGSEEKIYPVFSDVFDSNISPQNLLSLITSFTKKALLTNI